MAGLKSTLFLLFVLGSTFNCSCQLLSINKLSTMSDNKVVVYEDVKSATQNNSIYIIDVREPQELKDSGSIPNSINIPRKYFCYYVIKLLLSV